MKLVTFTKVPDPRLSTEKNGGYIFTAAKRMAVLISSASVSVSVCLFVC